MRAFPTKVFKEFPKEFATLKTLKNPSKIQDFLDDIEINFEKEGETCSSPLTVLKIKRAHCIEGAMLAAAALWLQGNHHYYWILKLLMMIKIMSSRFLKRQSLGGS